MDEIPELLRLLGHFRWAAEVGLCLTTISLGLRLYTRLRILKQFGVDDWAAVLAWVRIRNAIILRSELTRIDCR